MIKSLFNYSLYSHPEIRNFRVWQFGTTGEDIPDHGSDRVGFRSGCRVEIHGPRLTRHMCGSGRVWSGFGFLVIISGRIGLGLVEFRVFSYNFQVGSGWVEFFPKFGWKFRPTPHPSQGRVFFRLDSPWSGIGCGWVWAKSRSAHSVFVSNKWLFGQLGSITTVMWPDMVQPNRFEPARVAASSGEYGWPYHVTVDVWRADWSPQIPSHLALPPPRPAAAARHTPLPRPPNQSASRHRRTTGPGQVSTQVIVKTSQKGWGRAKLEN
jgi:hypothetical protein